MNILRSNRNQQGFSLLLLVILIALISAISFGSYIYLKSKKSDNQSESVSQPELPTTLNSSPKIPVNNINFDSTTNYILYTVDKDGFKPLMSLKNLTPNAMFGQTHPYFDSDNTQFFVADARSLAAYSLDGKKIKDVYKLNEPNLAISTFSIDRSRYAYVSLLPKDYESQDGSYIEEVNLVDGKTRRINSPKTVMYGNLSYLFKTTQNEDVIGSFGGDGCGGFGEISIIKPNTNELIAKTGGGCVEDPRYIGNIPPENKIVLLSVVKDSWNETTGDKLDKIYTKDIYSQEEKVIYNFAGNSDKLRRYYLNQKKNKIYLVYTDKIRPLNLITGQLENDIPVNKNINFEENYYSLFQDNNLYYIKEEPITDNFNMTLKIANVQTGSIQEYNWNKKYSLSGQASIIGFWQDQPIISLYVYPKN